MELVTVRTFSNYISANILLSKLRSCGIECYLKDENTATLLANALCSITLVIKKDDVPKVIELFRQFDEEDKKNTVCPKCGSNNIELVPKHSAANTVASVLSWLFFTKMQGSSENIYQCNDCGYESETLPESLNTDDTMIEQKNLN